jgi:hypothetical protein
MKIYRDHIFVEEVPDHRSRPGEFFSRLVGVHVCNDGNNTVVEPVYMPLIRVQKGDGTVTIWINSRERPLWMIFLTPRWPFIRAFRYDWLLLDHDLENA